MKGLSDQRVGQVPLQDLDGESHLVADSLTTRLPAAPQFEILDAVVESVAVLVMDGFVRFQWPPQVLCHDVPMLGIVGFATNQPTVAFFDRDDPIAVVDPRRNAGISDAAISLNISRSQESAVVDTTAPAGIMVPPAAGHRASACAVGPQLVVAPHVAVADESQVMAVAKSSLSRQSLTTLNRADSRLSTFADGHGVAREAGALLSAVVGFAESAAVERTFTFVDLAHVSIVVASYDEKRWCATLVWMAAIREFAQLVDEIRSSSGPVRLVGVDGCGGAGKTTFARRLTAAANDDWPVIHTDDFATHDEPIEWWPRLLAQVIEPLLDRRPATFRPYDWVHRRPGDETTVAPSSVVVIEGVGATRKAWRDRLTTGIWIQTDPDLRLQRGLARDGEELADFWRDWRVAEDRYVDAEHPQDHADLVVAGDSDDEHDPDKEFVVLSERQRGAAGRGAGGTSRRG